MRLLFQGALFFLTFQVFAHPGTGLSNINIDSLLLTLDEQKIDSLKIEKLTQFAWHAKHSNRETSFKVARLLLKNTTKTNYPKGIADASHTLGMLYWYQGDYRQAADYYFRALSIREKLGNSKDLARSYNNVGNVYFHQKKYKKALEYYQHSLELRTEVNDSIGLIYSYNNLGNVYNAEKEYELALNHYNKAYNFASKIKSDKGKAFVSRHMGYFQLHQQAFVPAYQHFAEGLKLYRTLRHQNGTIECLNGMAKALVLQKSELALSIEHSEKAIRLARKHDAKKLQAEAEINLAAAHAELGEYKQAFNLERKSRFLQEELLNETRERAIIETQIQYDVEKKESAFFKQENELLLKQKQLYQLQILIVFCFLLTAIIVSALIYARLRSQASMTEALERKNQELEQSNEALERFAYVSSHDLKEPLRTIGSFSTLLKRRYHDQLDQEGKEYIDYVVNGVSKMYNLLEDLLDYSRLIHQHKELREEVNFNEVIASVKDSLNHSIQEKAVEIEIPPMPYIRSNASQMEQLFQNLINNAIKFNDKKQPKVSIEYQHLSGEHFFAVKDNGLGIDAQYQDKIFDVFQRLSRKGYEGTGVGLAICKKIVEQHHGKIWVDSEEGKGSTFCFTIPELMN